MADSYELIRNAFTVKAFSEENLPANTAMLKILVIEQRNQPVMLAPETTLSVDGNERTATIVTDEGRVTMPLSELWSMLNNAVLKRVRNGQDANRSAYVDASTAYANEIVGEMADRLDEMGGEWELPSVWGEDMVTIGTPARLMRPKTLYTSSSNKRVHIVCEDEDGEEYTELVGYPQLSVDDTIKLRELLTRPIDEDEE